MKNKQDGLVEMENDLWIGKYITFIPVPVTTHHKTKRWDVVNHETHCKIGGIGWFSRFRKYSFFPETKTVYEETCLRQISFFLETQMARYKAEKKSNNKFSQEIRDISRRPTL
jgi:hypothetical protein